MIPKLPKVEALLEPYIYEWIAKKSGSISAEHGLGLQKRKAITYSRNETSIRLMQQIKDLYDPVSGSRTGPQGYRAKRSDC
jgi:FAD/FMN-containing dehydrogenase